MTKVNLTEAAKRVGVTRQTFYRHIEKKGISTSKDEQGNRLVDMSELARVYPKLDTSDMSESDKELHNHTPKKSNSDRMLQGEVDALRDQLAALNIEREREREQLSDTIEDLRQRLDKSEDERRDMSQRLLPAPEKATERPKGVLGWFGTRRG